jgi:hypothetical protein
MAKLRKVLDFFVTIESDEDKQVPPEAASKNPDEAAAAAAAYVEGGHEDFGSHPKGKQVRDVQRSRTNATLGDEFGGEDYDLSDLEAELSGDYDPRAAAGGGEGGGAPVDFGDGPLIVRGIDEVYEALGLPARDSDDFTIFTLMELLNSDHLKGLPSATKRASLMVAMQARNVEVGDVIADAIQRDQAIDMYDAELAEQLQTIEQETELKNEELQEKLREIMEQIRLEIEENNAALDSAREAYQAWRVVKQAEEQQLFDAVDPFVAQGDGNEITVDN